MKKYDYQTCLNLITYIINNLLVAYPMGNPSNLLLCLAISLFLACGQSMQAQADTLVCPHPQKGFYMSYNSISKRDTMSDVFKQINTKIKTYQYTYDDTKGTTYSIKNFHPQLYYNEHYQKQTPVDSQVINVTLGDVQYAFRFDYEVTKGSKTMGLAHGRILMDQTAYFLKKLMIIQGQLQWDPTQIKQLIVTNLVSIQVSTPPLPAEQKQVFELILNDHIGGKQFKAQILKDFNTYYKQILKTHLNKQHLIGNISYQYKYGNNIAMTFHNAIKNYTLSTSQVKGLQAFFMFELQNHTNFCTSEDSITFDVKKYGGLQEIYALPMMKSAFVYALQQGLFDVKVDKKWQVPAFQFYMGDLSNSVPQAAKYPAEQPFGVSCNWDKNSSNVKVNGYENHQIFAQVGQKCTISYQNKDIIETVFDMSFVVSILPAQETLVFVINGANVFSPTFKQLDPKFVVKDVNIARYNVAKVVNGLAHHATFGSGWKTAKRRFPNVDINGDYMIVFDPSEL